MLIPPAEVKLDRRYIFYDELKKYCRKKRFQL